MRSFAQRAIGLGAALLLGCPHSKPSEPALLTSSPHEPARPIAESVYAGALGVGWQDLGWAPRDVGHGPASLDLSNQGGWLIAKPGLTGSFGGVSMQVKAPAGEAEFLEVRLESPEKTMFPRVKVRAEHKTDIGDGWSEVFLPMAELDPEHASFDRIVIRAFRDIPAARVLVDKVGLVATVDGGLAEATATAATFSVDCRAKGRKVSPLIYGIAWESANKSDAFAVGATARRWGGNPTTRYNYELGNAWNTANDWYFENVEVRSHTVFFDENRAHGMTSALTVPMLGWVAKDTTSYSFPVATFGAQQKTDGYKNDAGNGNKPDGKPITPGTPTRTSVEISPEWTARWIDALKRDGDGKGRRNVDIAILDNEPGLWDSTHRDVHPDPVTYDELVDKSIRYATAIKKADPKVRIAGPAEWGWLGYMYSAKDKAAGVRLKPDRRAHGDDPLVVYYLKKMRDAEKAAGTRLLDLLDLHFYPQGDGVFSDSADPKVASLRMRETRGLWDRAYVDESWIHESLYVLPRMREWIDQSYPGTSVMIGEWNFGGEKHMSGGLATAEALGRFAQYGVDAAFYWTVPPDGSPAANAFRAYRDFDGKGGRFGDYFLPATAPEGASAFASRDKAGGRLVLVILNFAPDVPLDASVDLASCGGVKSVSARTYTGQPTGFGSANAATAVSRATARLPPYSITVLDLALDTKLTAPTDD